MHKITRVQQCRICLYFWCKPGKTLHDCYTRKTVYYNILHPLCCAFIAFFCKNGSRDIFVSTMSINLATAFFFRRKFALIRRFFVSLWQIKKIHVLPMTSPTLFKEYIWLVNTITKVRRITFADINDRWCETEMSGGVEIARATFNRHRRHLWHLHRLRSSLQQVFYRQRAWVRIFPAKIRHSFHTTDKNGRKKREDIKRASSGEHFCLYFYISTLLYIYTSSVLLGWRNGSLF